MHTHMRTMEDSKSPTVDNDDDRFFDAFDEFPFYEAVSNSESDHSVSQSSSNSVPGTVEDNANASIESKHTPEVPSPAGIRRRRSFSPQIRKDISLINSETPPVSTVITTSAIPMDKKYRFSWNLKENGKQSEKSGFSRARFSSGSIDNRLKDNESSTITTAKDEKEDESITVDSRDSSSSFLFSFAGLVIKAIGFQINLLVSFVTFPIWLLYCSYMFVIDPFRVMRRGRNYLIQKLSRIWGIFFYSIKSVVHGWFKNQKTSWKLALRLGWGLLWSTYVCFILVSLLVSAFVFSGILIKYSVEEPIQMKEQLNFDYTRDSPVAFVPIISCQDLSCGVDCGENIELGINGETRVIPRNHKLQVTVSLTLPESDYNRNLGIFQLRVDFLSANVKALASSRQPCMLQFKSQPIRLLSIFFNMVPLVTGYLSETQTLNIKFRGFTERDMPTSCLRVTLEQRAEFKAGAGIPEIYAASLNLESEIPLPKRILWSWKGTIFIWTSLTVFTVELIFALLFCKPLIVPQVRLRGGSADSNASQKVRPAQSKLTMSSADLVR